jgi:DNA-binding CsgD family transcriptional regulator
MVRRGGAGRERPRRAECERHPLAARGAQRRRRPHAQRTASSEQRIADMAATGLANADIAQALFLTVKTVEMHLTAAYRKSTSAAAPSSQRRSAPNPRDGVQGFPRRIAAPGRSPLRPCSIQRRHLRPPAAHDRPALSRPLRAPRLPMLPHGARAFSGRWATPLHWASCSRRTSTSKARGERRVELRRRRIAATRLA